MSEEIQLWNKLPNSIKLLLIEILFSLIYVTMFFSGTHVAIVLILLSPLVPLIFSILNFIVGVKTEKGKAFGKVMGLINIYLFFQLLWFVNQPNLFSFR